jgi:hypothetical protein
MTIIILAAGCAVILCWLHTRAMSGQRQTFEDRLDGQAQRHAQDLRKLLDASTVERTDWHRTLEQQHATLLAQVDAERTVAADERVQLLNRIKPETFHPPLSQPEAVSTPPAVGFEDDVGYWRASESRDELVERVEREMQAARVT